MPGGASFEAGDGYAMSLGNAPEAHPQTPQGNVRIAGVGAASEIKAGEPHRLRFALDGSRLDLYDDGRLVLSVVAPTLIPAAGFIGLQTSMGPAGRSSPPCRSRPGATGAERRIRYEKYSQISELCVWVLVFSALAT
ncbi:hypothetical protein AB0L65_40790 [Nonomuraea sp. NPDC052116]|uniref:hypothetical protein n=1 Tax=Nonomuraea sp. NPDC052116 TaxID=3155665 RepID=UPI00341ACF1D